MEKTLTIAFELDGGGYEFTVPPEPLKSFGAFIWTDPDPDFLSDFTNEFFYELDNPVYAFRPLHYFTETVEWPKQFKDQDGDTLTLITHGERPSSEFKCNCAGHLIKFAEGNGTAKPLPTETVLKWIIEGSVAIPDALEKFTWGFDQNPKWGQVHKENKPHPECERCEGEGYVDVPAGQWALYAITE